jgi:hypothetical protein
MNERERERETKCLYVLFKANSVCVCWQSEGEEATHSRALVCGEHERERLRNE